MTMKLNTDQSLNIDILSTEDDAKAFLKWMNKFASPPPDSLDIDFDNPNDDWISIEHPASQFRTGDVYSPRTLRYFKSGGTDAAQMDGAILIVSGSHHSVELARTNLMVTVASAIQPYVIVVTEKQEVQREMRALITDYDLPEELCNEFDSDIFNNARPYGPYLTEANKLFDDIRNYVAKTQKHRPITPL